MFISLHTIERDEEATRYQVVSIQYVAPSSARLVVDV